MLKRAVPTGGVTLIELMVVLAVIGIALLLGAPTYFQWNQNSRIRSAAESAVAGIKLARTEAVKRNATVSWQMMDLATCTASKEGPDWIVSQGVADDRCGASIPDQNFYIVRVNGSSEKPTTVRYSWTPGTQSRIDFNALGQATAGDLRIDVANDLGGACIADGGALRCLRILVTAGGQSRLCDPDPAIIDSKDPRHC